MKEKTICSTCGTYMEAATAPTLCPICCDERQYIPDTGQHWTKPEELLRTHSIRINQLKENLYELEINPVFAIGQRAMLVISPGGNVLWDCIPLLDESTIAFIKSKGGLKAIAFSHPHYYSNMNEWATVFDCPVYIHKNDAEHVPDKNEHIKLWEGKELALWDGIRILLIGGHFAGSCILHVPDLSPQGTILCGDTLFLSPSKKHFSVQWSYPNKMPLPVREMARVRDRFDEISFDAFYGYQRSQNLDTEVEKIFMESMERYFA